MFDEVVDEAQRQVVVGRRTGPKKKKHCYLQFGRGGRRVHPCREKVIVAFLVCVCIKGPISSFYECIERRGYGRDY